MVAEKQCANCENTMKIEENQCPICGSRNMRLDITDEYVMFDQISLRAKNKGQKKAFKEVVSGHETSDKYGIVEKKRVIDRENDWYEEEVKTLDGIIAHDCKEKLSDHRGHGSAKKKRSDG